MSQDTGPTSASKAAPHTDQPHSPWGRSSRLGGGTGRLLLVSAILGIAVAAMVAALVMAFSSPHADADPHHAWMTAGVVGVSSAPVLAALMWVILVDRGSLEGAVRHPEQSIESHWYDRAATGAFHDLLIVLGLGTAAVSLTGWEVPLSTVGAGLFAFMALDVAVRYQLQKRRG